jgi:hypothetical protein
VSRRASALLAVEEFATRDEAEKRFVADGFRRFDSDGTWLVLLAAEREAFVRPHKGAWLGSVIERCFPLSSAADNK